MARDGTGLAPLQVESVCQLRRTNVMMKRNAILFALPAAVILIAAVPVVGDTSYAPPAEKTFEITAKRFAFEPATIEVTQGDTVKLTVKSSDSTHGFEI